MLTYTPRRMASADFEPMSINRPLTKQQQAVYDFIRDKIVSRGYGPTVREIGRYMNISSPNGVMCHLRALERKDMIRRTANKSRAIELTEPISRFMDASLPVGGRIAGGACALAAASEERLDLAAMATDPGRYVLKVQDDSLLDAHIRSGDHVLVQKQNFATVGQLAILRTGDAETCVRYWIPENGRVRLQPANRALPPTMVDQAEVLGVVVGVVRLLGDAS